MTEEKRTSRSDRSCRTRLIKNTFYDGYLIITCNCASRLKYSLAFARSTRRLAKRAECCLYARLGALFERIARLLVGIDKGSGKRKRGGRGTRRGCVRGATRIKLDKKRSNRRWFLCQLRLQKWIFASYMSAAGERVAPNLSGEPKICSSPESIKRLLMFTFDRY